MGDFEGNCPHEILFLVSGVHHIKEEFALKRMPELPDISAYLSALNERIVGQPLDRVQIGSPFLLRTASPPIAAAEGHTVIELRRIRKREAIGGANHLGVVMTLQLSARPHMRI